MPGVSSRSDIPGAQGIGKVKLRFRHVDEKKRSKIGLIVFLFCFSMIAFSIAWRYPLIRFGVQIPTLQRLNSLIQRVRVGARPTHVDTTSIRGDGRITSRSSGNEKTYYNLCLSVANFVLYLRFH